ncbi:ankyrin repeats (3 copies) domain-containing protein [Cordyceps javanica]|nr:ankyrin repeats (3 copies) domain-containing protein [Cordyceps javanica]
MATEPIQEPRDPDDKPENHRDIFFAAKAGDLAAVKDFAEKEKDNFDVHKTSTSDLGERTAFSIACEYNHCDVAEYLLERGANPERDNGEELIEMTPLHWAAQQGHIEVVNLLQKRLAGVDVKNCDDRTALWLAAKGGYPEIVTILLEHTKTDRNSADDLGRSPLSVAAENGKVAVVEVLLGDASVDPAWEDMGRETPLYLAASNGHKEAVELLARAAPHTLDYPEMDGRTPLIEAASEGHLEIVRWLLGQALVNPMQRDQIGFTALMSAMDAKHKRIVDLLIPRDNISLHLLVSQTPTFEDQYSEVIPPATETWSKSEEDFGLTLAKSLLNAGYNVNTKTDAGVTALQSAVQKKRLQSICFLIHEHASIEGITADEWRALLTPNVDEVSLILTTNKVVAVPADRFKAADLGTNKFYDLYSLIPGKGVSWDDLYEKMCDDCSPLKHLWETSTLKLSIWYCYSGYEMVVSITFALPVEDAASQYNRDMPRQSEIKMVWRCNLFSNEPLFYLSSFPDGWAHNGEFEIQVMRKVAEAWTFGCRQARLQLAAIRDEQLMSEGRRPELMSQLANLAKTFAFYRVELEKQLADARAFLTVYDSIDNRHTTKIKSLLEEEWEKNIGNEIEKLEQNVRDVLQIRTGQHGGLDSPPRE